MKRIMDRIKSAVGRRKKACINSLPLCETESVDEATELLIGRAAFMANAAEAEYVDFEPVAAE